MAIRIPISGFSDQALQTPGAGCREFISGANFDGNSKKFWLTGVVIANEHATEVATVEVYDQDEAAAVAASQRLTLLCPPLATTVFDFPLPGIQFFTNITGGTTLGTINAYGVTASGYME